MYEFADVVDFYIEIINALKSGIISPQSPLEEIALKDSKGGSIASFNSTLPIKRVYQCVTFLRITSYIN